MAVETLTNFPQSFFAGDTIRVSISDSDFPSTGWSLNVVLQSATTRKSFAATAGTAGAFNLVISAADSAQIVAGVYSVSFVYVETATSERKTVPDCFTTTVYSNPTVTPAKSIARQTLEAMETAFKKMASGSNLSVNFNGQSFTKRNLKEFQEAIEFQRAVVAREEVVSGGPRAASRILHPI